MNMTLKDVMKNDYLVRHITEDIEDIPEDTEVSYEVWAIGYNADQTITDAELLMAEFTDPDEAIRYARNLVLADIVQKASEDNIEDYPPNNVAYISIEVETVIEDEDDGTMNVGTIYKRDLWIDDEYDSEEDLPEPEDEYSEVVPVTAKDYKLLEDGSLEISCDILKNFNKNDMVQIWFTDENKDYHPILTYKIISKTTDDKFICEFIY